MSTKAMTLRLDETQAAELETVARVDGVPITQAVRDAIAGHIETRRRDESFQNRIRSIIEREQAVYDRLAQ